jgi:hypothetical protein
MGSERMAEGGPRHARSGGTEGPGGRPPGAWAFAGPGRGTRPRRPASQCHALAARVVPLDGARSAARKSALSGTRKCTSRIRALRIHSDPALASCSRSQRAAEPESGAAARERVLPRTTRPAAHARPQGAKGAAASAGGPGGRRPDWGNIPAPGAFRMRQQEPARVGLGKVFRRRGMAPTGAGP